MEWGTLDFLIADLPPGTGDEVLTITQRTFPQLALIVTTPQELYSNDSPVSRGFRQLASQVDAVLNHR